MEKHENDSSPYEIQRENLAEPKELPVIDEPVELVDKPLATSCKEEVNMVLRCIERFQ